MNIHFVCAGNTNRSRMAEAYLNSKKILNINGTSSGIRAEDNLNGRICSYSKHILEENNIINFTSSTWTQCNSEIIEAADVVIFMQSEYLEYVQKELKISPLHYEIWNIPDVPIRDTAPGEQVDLTLEAERLAYDEKIYKMIVEKVDDLVHRIEK